MKSAPPKRPRGRPKLPPAALERAAPTEPQREALRVLHALIERGEVVPGYQHLANELGVTKNAVKARLKGLAARGIIEERVVIQPAPWTITKQGLKWL